MSPTETAPFGRAEVTIMYAKGSKVQILPLDKIDDNPIQPPHRAGSGIRDLTADIQRTHFVTPVVVTPKGSRYIAIDGHRRIAALRSVGVDKVPAIVLDTNETVQTLFLILNRSAKHINAANLFWAWAQESRDKREAFLQLISGTTRRNIERMVEYLGMTDAARYADDKNSPHLAKFIKDAQNILVSNSLESPPLNVIGKWVIDHSQTNAVNRLRRDPQLNKPKARRLLEAILANRPLLARKPAKRRVARKVAA